MRRQSFVPFIPSVVVQRIFIVGCVAALAACGPKQETVTSARPMTEAEVAASKVQPGDCVEARRRAAAQPDLEVDRLPELVRGPRPFTPTPTSETP